MRCEPAIVEQDPLVKHGAAPPVVREQRQLCEVIADFPVGLLGIESVTGLLEKGCRVRACLCQCSKQSGAGSPIASSMLENPQTPVPRVAVTLS